MAGWGLRGALERSPPKLEPSGRGVLVTTARVGPETKAFAARNNRLRIIEGGELKHLLAEHLDLDVRIDLGRPPRRKP